MTPESIRILKRAAVFMGDMADISIGDGRTVRLLYVQAILEAIGELEAKDENTGHRKFSTFTPKQGRA